MNVSGITRNIAHIGTCIKNCIRNTGKIIYTAWYNWTKNKQTVSHWQNN